ncbi:hypothetical protein BVY00_02665 [bacterium G20]|nr:hypothetical protein BVY00_02665 [bacterium G20]
MLEQVAKSQAETRKKRSQHSLKKAGALVSLVATLATPAVAQARHENGSNKTAEAAASAQYNTDPKRLKNPSELPGAKIEISKRTQELHRAATVQIIVKDNNKFYSLACSGTKTGPNEVSTAEHCVDQMAQLQDSELVKPNGPPAQDFIKLAEASGLEYFIADSQASLGARESYPIAKVTGIALNTRGVDFALLKVEEIPINYNPAFPQANYPIRHFSEIPSIPLPNKPLRPIPGQKVTISALPHYPGGGVYNQLLTQNGVYLGTMPTADGGSSDVVAFNYNKTKICDAGSSGSSFAADTKNGLFVSGALRGTRNFKFISEDYTSPGTIKSGIKAALENGRQEHAKLLGINLGSFDGLCIYPIVNNTMVEDLRNSFGHYADPAQFPPPTS